MNRFQILNVLYIAALAFIAITERYSTGIEYKVLFLLFLSYVFILFLGVVFTQLNLFVEHELAGNARYNEIALSFDDGPNAEFTPQVLDKLSQYNVKAGFFLIGQKVDKYPELVKRIDKEGHLIGNHSYYHHIKFDFMGSREARQEIELTNESINKIIGKTPRFFRPPFGITQPRIARAIHQSNMIPVAWSLRTYDTKKSKYRVIKKLRRKLNGGDIILLHDKHPEIIEILEFLIPYAENNGFKFVRIDELINQKPYEIS